VVKFTEQRHFALDVVQVCTATAGRTATLSDGLGGEQTTSLLVTTPSNDCELAAAIQTSSQAQKQLPTGIK